MRFGLAVLVLVLARPLMAQPNSLQAGVLRASRTAAAPASAPKIDLEAVDKRYRSVRQDQDRQLLLMKATNAGVEVLVDASAGAAPFAGVLVSHLVSKQLDAAETALRGNLESSARQLLRQGYSDALSRGVVLNSGTSPEEVVERVFGAESPLSKIDGLRILDDADPIRREARTALLIETLKRETASGLDSLRQQASDNSGAIAGTAARVTSLKDAYDHLASTTTDSFRRLTSAHQELAQGLDDLSAQVSHNDTRLTTVEEVLLGSLPPAERLRALERNLTGSLSETEVAALKAELRITVATERIGSALAEVASIGSNLAQIATKLGLDEGTARALTQAASAAGLAQQAVQLYGNPTPAGAVALVAGLVGFNSTDPAAERHQAMLDNFSRLLAGQQRILDGIEDLKVGQRQILENQARILGAISSLSDQVAAQHGIVLAQLQHLKGAVDAGRQVLQYQLYVDYNLCRSALQQRPETLYLGGRTTAIGPLRRQSLRVAGFYVGDTSSFEKLPSLAGCKRVVEEGLVRGLSDQFSPMFLVRQTLDAPQLEAYTPRLESLRDLVLDSEEIRSEQAGRVLAQPVRRIQDLLSKSPRAVEGGAADDRLWASEEIAVRIVVDVGLMILETHALFEVQNPALTQQLRETLVDYQRLVDAAIAQQALAAGDLVIAPILESLNSPDRQGATSTLATAGKALARNDTLLQNFVLASVHQALLGAAGTDSRQRFARLWLYSLAWQHDSGARLAAVLPSWLNPTACGEGGWCVDLESGPLKVVGRKSVELPTPRALITGRVAYSVEMADLVEIRGLVATRIKELDPTAFLGQENAEALVALLAL